MGTVNVAGKDLIPRGNLDLRMPIEGTAEVSYNADFTGANNTYIFQFAQLQAQKLFSVPRCMFVDNSNNPSIVTVTVSQTGQSFPVPPYSAGYFPISAQDSSSVTLFSAGGASTSTNVQFFNYDISGVVWTGFTPNNPNLGAFVYGPDNVGSSPTKPPVLVGGIDGGGLIRRLLTTTAGVLLVQSQPLTGATMATAQPAGVTNVAARIMTGGTFVHREFVNMDPANTIWIGFTSGVTNLTGFPVYPGSSYNLSDYAGDVYAIASVAGPVPFATITW